MSADTCVHCGLGLDLIDSLPGWGVHTEGVNVGLSRCDPYATGQPYGLNGHTAGATCAAPCAGRHIATRASA